VSWAGSAMFTGYVADCVALTGDVRTTWYYTTRFRVALYDAQPTPDRQAPRADTWYPTGEWTRDRELTGPGWTQPGGYSAGGQIQVGGDGSCGIWAPGLTRGNVTLAGIAGDLMWYRDPFTSPDTGRASCFHDFGGLVDVADGQLTLTWPPEPAGYFRICVG
jgi:hypothetical protein